MAERCFGPDGGIITIEDLPLPSQRATPGRKALLLFAVRGGLISVTQLRSLYGVSDEEFEHWKAMYHQHGAKGLRASKLQQYRDLADA